VTVAGDSDVVVRAGLEPARRRVTGRDVLVYLTVTVVIDVVAGAGSKPDWRRAKFRGALICLPA